MRHYLRRKCEKESSIVDWDSRKVSFRCQVGAAKSGPSIQKFKVRFHWGVWLCFAIFKRLEDLNCLLRYVAWGLKTKAFPPPGSFAALPKSQCPAGPALALWSLVHRSSQTALPRACPASWAPASMAYVSLVAWLVQADWA